MKGGGLTFIQTKDAEPGGGEENEFCGRGLRGRWYPSRYRSMRFSQPVSIQTHIISTYTEIHNFFWCVHT